MTRFDKVALFFVGGMVMYGALLIENEIRLGDKMIPAPFHFSFLLFVAVMVIAGITSKQPVKTKEQVALEDEEEAIVNGVIRPMTKQLESYRDAFDHTVDIIVNGVDYAYTQAKPKDVIFTRYWPVELDYYGEGGADAIRLVLSKVRTRLLEAIEDDEESMSAMYPGDRMHIRDISFTVTLLSARRVEICISFLPEAKTGKISITGPIKKNDPDDPFYEDEINMPARMVHIYSATALSKTPEWI